MSELWIASLVVLWLLTLFLAFLLAGALRQIGLLQIRLGSDPGALITRTGLDRGTSAPDFDLIDVRTDEQVRLSKLARRPRVLAFISTNCSSCIELIPHLNEVIATRRSEFEFLAICRGSMASCLALSQDSGLQARMLHDPGGLTETAYSVSLTPFVFVLDADNRVAIRGVANSWVQLDSLLDQEGSLEPATVDSSDHEPEHEHEGAVGAGRR